MFGGEATAHIMRKRGEGGRGRERGSRRERQLFVYSEQRYTCDTCKLNIARVVILTTGVRELARDRNCNSWESGGSREREEWGAGGVGGGEWEREGVRSGEGDACDVVVPDDV